MPRFSVIVPAYKVQAYLYESLHSVLRQSFTDLELIAVDDCSPDGSGEIIDELAAADLRVRPVHLTENVGLGRARNAGMEHATGDYLIFLDGDDTLTPGALAATADRLKETGSPDVLIYDYARTYWTGREVRNMQAAQLSQDGPAPFRLADRPGLMKLLMVVWNKAYSREFIEREGLRFPPGYYEDTPFTYPVLMAAETIATLDRVCVHYRQRRQGNILGTTSRKHFDIFDQYDRVFAHFDARPEFAAWRPVVFRRMVDHYATVFARPERLPRRSRPEFLRRAREQYRRHHVPGLRLDPRARVRHGLIRFAAHRTYRALRLAKAAKLRLRTLVKAVRRDARAGLLRLHYRVQLCLPVRDDRAVFAAYRARGHGGDPGAVEEKVRELAPHIRTAWIAGPAHHHTVPTATRRITPGTAAYWTALARSKYLVLGTDLGHRLVKRRAQVRVQAEHGTPLKRMGLDLQDRPAAARGADFAALLDDADTWDYVLSANRHSTLVRERVLPGSYTTLEYGQPRNDRFLHAGSQDVAHLRDSLGIPQGTLAILYAPTARDHRRSQHRPLDLDRVLRALGPRCTVLTRAHPTYGEPLSGGEHARIVDVSDHPSVESLCLASDALITDYSSLMFDYANLDRPIVLFTDDREVYEATRGTYFDLRSCPPGPLAQDEDELIDIFATGHWRGSRSAQLRAAFRERFCALDDGRAAERVVRHVFLGQSAGLPPVLPLADRRPAPVPPVGEHLPEQSQGPVPGALLPTNDN
ncbi:bifunctional glycosyltransferase family 2 protein/CDP-glycerol:glycerophosphate glycerophosphotransferase [Streptomyces sp. LHD-70]|uniref:bifunctional glycosyltransferase/CDP-glycerol:glycerophosphate glycerophosphotransferase n=1 Tax=Streptomyces sp. LHD-70 TaxID=3072140 RepID=UPI00280EBD9B|nr:bifunctional glycosyltransferase family 2 protein/CDP-glycerol:glycerophosphate glycerophosphotransferase [Streptomyces sp. LHD-70]MDQ8705800.1 bifunctional glycosyltransferase family 2 protein/CDP-glycerol:glycerophosphate glycerophosphotransferase [Streptomyces sp. LHD-70]